MLISKVGIFNASILEKITCSDGKQLSGARSHDYKGITGGSFGGDGTVLDLQW